MKFSNNPFHLEAQCAIWPVGDISEKTTIFNGTIEDFNKWEYSGDRKSIVFRVRHYKPGTGNQVLFESEGVLTSDGLEIRYQ